MAPVEKTEEEKLFDKMMNDINVTVDDFHKSFATIAANAMNAKTGSTSTAPSNTFPPLYNPKKVTNKPQSLPWFKHGIKGFFQKLWHGDHATNPDWKGYGESLTLEASRFLQEQIDIATNTIIEEVKIEVLNENFAVVDNVFGPLVQRFKDNLTTIIKQTFNKGGWLNKPVSSASQKTATKTQNSLFPTGASMGEEEPEAKKVGSKPKKAKDATSKNTKKDASTRKKAKEVKEEPKEEPKAKEEPLASDSFAGNLSFEESFTKLLEGLDPNDVIGAYQNALKWKRMN